MRLREVPQVRNLENFVPDGFLMQVPPLDFSVGDTDQLDAAECPAVPARKFCESNGFFCSVTTGLVVRVEDVNPFRQYNEGTCLFAVGENEPGLRQISVERLYRMRN